MKFLITHKTDYLYKDTVNICYNEGWMIPRNTPSQKCIGNEIKIAPATSHFDTREDFFGNKVFRFTIEQPHNRLTVTSRSEVELNAPVSNHAALFDFISWEQAIEDCKSLHSDILDARQFSLFSPMIAMTNDIRKYAEISFTPRRPLFEAGYDLMKRIHQDFEFDPHFTNIATPLSVVLKEKKGVCQDFAHLAIACVRAMGIPARYVSGYIETMAPPGKEKLVGTDASHAWMSIFIPGKGWVDFDPTNNQIPSNQHITVAYGRDYADLPPLKGVIYSSGEQKMIVSVDVKRLG